MSEPHDQLDHFEEFEEFGDEEFHDAEHAQPQGLKEKLGDMWRNNPAFKVGVIGATVVAVVGGAYAFMGGTQKPVSAEAVPSRVGGSENVKGTVGADVTPEYQNLLQKDNQQRAEQALQEGKSAIPTPVGNVATAEQKKEEPVDPLAMWRQAEQQKPAPAPPPGLQQADNNAQQQQQQQQQDLSQLTQAMQQQITSLTQAWQPTQATVVSFQQPQNTANNNAATNANNPQSTAGTVTTPEQKIAKVIVPAGDILYGAMITEANSDVPGPILAQVMSGPLKGGRLIGAFQVSQDYLVIQFTTLSINGHSYAINALALDPNTTLGGMATEVDQRYFTRLIIPAAASFVSRFGQAISQPAQTTTIGANGTVVVSQEKQSTRDALYGGAGDAASQVSQFMSQQASQTKPLVRVASNTPVGIFFTKPVTDQPQDSNR